MVDVRGNLRQLILHHKLHIFLFSLSFAFQLFRSISHVVGRRAHRNAHGPAIATCERRDAVLPVSKVCERVGFSLFGGGGQNENEVEINRKRLRVEEVISVFMNSITKQKHDKAIQFT